MGAEKLRILSLCSGIGGMDLGTEHALGNASTVMCVEENAFCRAVLAKHFPDALLLEDVTSAPPIDELDGTDVLVTGFPCQPHANCGRRRGTADTRWLWPAIVRWIDVAQPRLIIIENVPGLLTSSHGEAFNEILFDLYKRDYDVRWRTISASEVGAPQLRKRVVMVAILRGSKRVRLAAPRAPDWGHAGWPARPSQQQYAYEPPRVAPKVKNRRHRLRALGNGMVPLVAYVAALWAREALQGLWGDDVSGKVVVAFTNQGRAPRQATLFAPQQAAPCPRWPKSGIMHRGVVRALPAKKLPVPEVLWPAATASDSRGSRRNTARQGDWTSHTGTTLTDAVQGDAPENWATPAASVPNDGEAPEQWEARKAEHAAKDEGATRASMPLSVMVQKDWPTALASDDRNRNTSNMDNREQHHVSLSQLVGDIERIHTDEWATPRSSEGEMRTYSHAPTHGAAEGPRHGKVLQAEVIELDGDPTAPAAGERRKESGALNPDWVELLMGLPIGWTYLDEDLTRKVRRKQRAPKTTAPQEG